MKTMEAHQQVVKAARVKKSWTADECSMLCAKANVDYNDGDENKMVQFVASTETADREGDVMRIAGMDAKNFLSNPVFLYVHDYESIPIGVVLKLEAQNKTLLATVLFHSVTDEAKDLCALCQQGYLRAVSIGFQGKPGGSRSPTDTERVELGMRNFGVIYESWELFEISLCPIGMNPEALQVRGLKKKTIDLLKNRQGIIIPTIEESLKMTPEELKTAIDESISKGIAMAVTGCDVFGKGVKSGDKLTAESTAAIHEAHKCMSKALSHISSVVAAHPTVPAPGEEGGVWRDEHAKSIGNAIVQAGKGIAAAKTAHHAAAPENDGDEDDTPTAKALLQFNEEKFGAKTISPLEALNQRLTGAKI